MPISSPHRRQADAWIIAAVAALLGVLFGGLAFLAHYQSKPGAVGAVPTIWPADSTIVREPGLPTVILFAHPRCGCTAATLSELRGLVSHLQYRATFHVRFLLPEDTGQDWLDTPNWRSATSIDGVHVAPDPGGAEARRFGALTSGVAVLYDAAGILRFTGGITPSRGHMGDNAGRAEILAAVRAFPVTVPRSPVFGCALDDPNPVVPR